MSGLPVIIDAFCCAGGASKGYEDAGFDVVGVDIKAQRNYPYEFHQGDALDALRTLLAGGALDFSGRSIRLDDVAGFHASPPCQFHSRMSNCRPGLAGTYPDHIASIRQLLEATSKPYVIENVVGAPLRVDLELCGMMFGRELYRHRWFEANFPLAVPMPVVPPSDPQSCGFDHPIPASKAGHWTPGTIMSVAGHFAPVAHARKIMEIDWTNRRELAESIPPYYSSFVGGQLMAHLRGEMTR